MSSNKLTIAAAGSGKTTYLVNEALKQKDNRVLITTYTEANEAEIRKKIYKEVGCIPKNIIVQPWFSFLLQHGVRPYQGGVYEKSIKGMVLVNRQSAIKYKTNKGLPVYYKESEVQKHYFTDGQRIYSDKISKFVIKCNDLSNGAVISRLSKIFDYIFIDEVQDLASYDLDFLKLLFKSKISVFMVGDPRQVVYVTHHAKKFSKYSGGKIVDFIENECKGIDISVDEDSLKYSHRNNGPICLFSSKLFPDLPPCEPCSCDDCGVTTPHEGIFLIRKEDVFDYLDTFNPMQLRLNIKTKGVNQSFLATNFGLSKGQSFCRVLIFPTDGMRKWLVNKDHELAPRTRAHFYVGITRARHSVGMVYNFDENTDIEGIQIYIPGKN